MEQAQIGQFLPPKCEGFLVIVGGLGIELQGEFEFATPMGAGGEEGLQVGRYGGLVGGIDEQGPAMGREKVIQSV